MVIPPAPPSEVKFKFEVAFKDGRTTTRVVLCNADGCIVGAYVNHFVYDKSYCAELEAVVQAFHIAALQIEQASFKGDTANVIFAL